MTTTTEAASATETAADTPTLTVKDAPREVKIAAAKGRPMLSWVGKRPLGMVTAFLAQPVERFDPQHTLGPEPAEAYANGGLLFHGDNKEVLAHLLASGFRGKVNLIYIDPPFDSGADYVRKVSLRGGTGSAKLDGETYTLGEQTQYTDIWANDNYLQFMYERLLMLKELLAEDGCIYLHCDDRKNYLLRCLLDEVLGVNYRNEIVWKRTTARSDSSTYNHIHDTIYFYTKGNKFTWNKAYLPYSQEYLKSNFKMDADNRLYRETPLTAPGVRSGPSGQSWKGLNPGTIGKGRHWAIPSFVQHLLSDDAKENSQLALDELEAKGRIIWAKDGEGRPNVIQYSDDLKGVELQSIWLEFAALSSSAAEAKDYPTQKPEALLARIIQVSSNPEDLVLDCFIGSGTTAAVAQKLGRRWIGCDINKGAVQTTSKRLQSIITAQVAAQDKPAAKNGKAVAKGKADPTLPLEIDDTVGADESAADVPATTEPAQFAFSVWRVNDYDLQIQHNEAVELACQHLGVTRTKGDSFFEGTRGQSLVKIVPFNHPLSPLDLEQVKLALNGRPDETRPVLMVCLGVELAAQGWVEDWNRLRKKDDPNYIEYIELRTDSKYGKFFAHQPASAQVTVTRDGETGKVRIENFVSPTILERLAQTAGVLQPKIADWRAMVDCVLIDPAYDGLVFNVGLSDVPEKKTDLVTGEYEIALPRSPATVGVKIIDMLGEEVLETVKI